MNIEKAWRIAEVLILSAVRARRGRGSDNIAEAKTGLRNNKIFAFGFPVITLLTYIFLARGNSSPELISPVLSLAFTFLPFLSMFLMVMNGLMFEITFSEFNTSTDLINWLPILPSEYILGSTASSIYFSLPFLMIVYGITLGSAFYTGQVGIWIATVIVSLLAICIGGFLIEIVRAFLNEASSVISRRGGRLAQVLQLVSTVAVIAAMALLFNYNLILRLMEWFDLTLEQIWFIPMLWPSMIIQSLLERNIWNTSLYTAFSLALLAVSYYLGTYARRKYWVPKPITLTIGPSTDMSHSKLGSFSIRPEQVVALKDLKALSRRKEMMTLLAIPLMIFIANFIQMDVSLLWDETASDIERLGLFMLPGMGLYMLSLYISMISIGQEGKGFVNLQMSPITPRQILLGKASVGWVISSAIFMVMLALERYYIGVPLDAFFAITVIGFSTITEACFLGLMFGTIYPDFTEVPRARFISPKGSMISIIIASLSVISTISPSLLNHYMFNEYLSFWLTGSITLILTALVCKITFNRAENNLEELM